MGVEEIDLKVEETKVKKETLTEGGSKLSLKRMIPIPILRNLLLAILAVIIFFFLSGHLSPYRNYQLSQVGPYVLAILGLSVLIGQNGQISIGHGALMAIGAWSLALLQIHTKLPLGVILVLATLITTAIGGILGLVAARLRGPYLAGATLALALGVPDIATRYRSLFGGYQGLQINPPSPPAFLGANFTPQQYLAVIDVIVIVIAFVFVANLVNSRIGRDMRAVRDDEIAARLAGISVQRTQVFTFAISSGLAGLGGGLLALVASNVSPGAFSVTLSISLLSGLVIGGIGTMAGALWGAAVMVYVPQWATTLTEKFNMNQGIAANIALAIYGILLVVIVLAAPGGIQGILMRLKGLVSSRGSRRATKG